ncbi:MAG TPA: hypothetical protein DF383_14015, partial [Deltaproteobacteria bacterium]|nr:hypothetical protein [Deltaproteobacteria bacterium]
IPLGISLLLLFKYFRLKKLSWFLLSGFLIGVASIGFFLRPWHSPLLWLEIKAGILLHVIPAMIGTATFWYLGWSARNKPS